MTTTPDPGNSAPARRCFSIAAALIASFSITASADDLTKPLRVSENGHFLAQADGKPFFWLSDAAYEIAQRLDRDEADKYLQDRAQKGFTVIFTWPTGGFLLGLDAPNRYGDRPLIDRDPTRPNPRYFEHLDWIVERAAHYGLRVAMTPITGIRDIGGWWVKNTPQIFNADNARVYGRWLGARYRNKGVIWVMGGDINPLWPMKDEQSHFKVGNEFIVDFRPIFDAMAAGLIEGDGGDPFITYHLTGVSFPGTPRPRTSLYLHDRNWLDMNALQSGHFLDPTRTLKGLGADFGFKAAFNYEPIRDEYQSLPTRPVVDLEPAWEDIAINLDFKTGADGYFTAYDVRNAAYQAVFAGAAGHGYGNDNVTYFYNPKYHPAVDSQRIVWWQALSSPGAQQIPHVKALMLSRPYFTRIPDQSLIVGDPGEGHLHIGATCDGNGSYGMLYIPQGQAVTIDLSKIAGPKAVGWWFDPRTGTAARIKASIPTAGKKSFTPPTSGADQDWVLVIDSEKGGFAAPGVQQ